MVQLGLWKASVDYISVASDGSQTFLRLRENQEISRVVPLWPILELQIFKGCFCSRQRRELLSLQMFPTNLFCFLVGHVGGPTAVPYPHPCQQSLR